MGLVSGLNRIDRIVAARESREWRRAYHGEPVVGDGPRGVKEGIIIRHSIGIYDRVTFRWRAGPSWRRCSDQPLMIEEGAAKSRLEEIVQDRVMRMAALVQIRLDR